MNESAKLVAVPATVKVPGLDRPVRVSSRWRRRTVRHELQRAVDELAARAHRPAVTIWHVQPVIEICTAEHYPAWRKAREKTWRRERTQFNTRTWPQRLTPTELAGTYCHSHTAATTAGSQRKSRCPSSRTARRRHTRRTLTAPMSRWH